MCIRDRAVVVVLGVGFWRGGRAFSFQVPVLMYLALGVVGFLPPGGLHLPVFWRYLLAGGAVAALMVACALQRTVPQGQEAVSSTHLRAHETVLDLVCRLLLEKKNNSI